MFTKAEHKNPWLFVPTLSFTLGIPLIIATQVATMMYASFGLPNKTIGLLSILGLPVAFNVFFAPFVDSFGTKRSWILITQSVLVVCLLALAGCMLLNFHTVGISIAFVAILALASGVFSIPGSGFYVDALTKQEQAFFVGINTAAIRIAIIFTTGVLVIISGKFGEKAGNIYHGWSLFYAMCAAVILITAIWHWLVMPYPPAVKVEKKGYLAPFQEFLTQKNAILLIVYILIFRLGEGILTIMATPFFLNTIEEGGLAMTVAEVGFAKGTVGVTASIIGGIMAGFFLKGRHYKKMIIFFAICMTAPNALYIYLARFQPQDVTTLDFSFIAALWGQAADWTVNVNIQTLAAISIETFGYGMGYTAFVFLIYRIANESKFRATTISIAMAIQNIGWTLSGSVSGYIQNIVGYEILFTLSIVLSVPGIILLIMLMKKRNI